MFNTLGNFASYPHAGVAFVDFERNHVLQLSGRPRVLWDQNDSREETGGTHRLWELEVEVWHESTLPFQQEWEFLEYPPSIPEPNGG